MKAFSEKKRKNRQKYRQKMYISGEGKWCIETDPVCCYGEIVLFKQQHLF